MNKGQLSAQLAGVLAEDTGLPVSRVEAGLNALLGVVKARAAEGLPTYWEHIGLFEVADCAARRRSFWRGKFAERVRVIELCAPYKKLTFRRSVFLNALRTVMG